MEMEQNHQDSVTGRDFGKDGALLEELNSSTFSPNDCETTSSSGFECNICLDLVQDPVVTLCGHLYCWSCIYRWISSFDVSSEYSDQQEPQCPVCKAEVSEESLVPLYGRGASKIKASDLGLIPKRPSNPKCGTDTLRPVINRDRSYPIQQQIHNQSYVQPSQPYYSGNYTAPPSPIVGIGGNSLHLVDPMIGMFGEMVYARMFGNSQTTLYTYPNSYNLAGSGSPRLRRHMMQADKSLSRICFFLCCCAILCLLLF